MNGGIAETLVSVSYLLAARRKKDKPNEEELKARIELIKERKLDPELLQEVAKMVRPNDAIFAPFKRFMELESADFPAKVQAIIADIVEGRGAKRVRAQRRFPAKGWPSLALCSRSGEAR